MNKRMRSYIEEDVVKESITRGMWRLGRKLTNARD